MLICGIMSGQGSRLFQGHLELMEYTVYKFWFYLAVFPGNQFTN